MRDHVKITRLFLKKPQFAVPIKQSLRDHGMIYHASRIY
jgi:hypothetical protein